eukprot:7959255-Prorocentrum_lima.AAC.1
MTQKISTWGAQGLPWWLHVVQEARMTHQDWEKGRLEAKFALRQPFPTPPAAHELESILRVDLSEIQP